MSGGRWCRPVPERGCLRDDHRLEQGETGVLGLRGARVVAGEGVVGQAAHEVDIARGPGILEAAHPVITGAVGLLGITMLLAGVARARHRRASPRWQLVTRAITSARFDSEPRGSSLSFRPNARIQL